MGVPVAKVEPVDSSTAEALLSPLEGMPAADRRNHASIFNYWLSIKGDRQFPPIRDLDPLEISDAGPWSVLLEMIGAGENAVIRHLGQAIKLGEEAETIARAPEQSLLARIHARLPQVASTMQPMAFDDSFETPKGTVRCWVTLLPFSASGTWIDYVYGFVSLDAGEAEAQGEALPAIEGEADAFEVPLAPLDEEPDDEAEPERGSIVEDVGPDADPVAEPNSPYEEETAEAEPEETDELELEAELEPEPETAELILDEEADDDGPATKAGFSSKFLESLAHVGGFYGRVVQAPEPMVEESVPNQDAEPAFEVEASLQSKLSDVRAMAEQAREAQIRSNRALYAGLGAAYDFALDAEEQPEEYLRLVEGQGLKIQLRSPMKPVVRLAFAETCDDATIAQLEAVLAWALKNDLPRGSLAERIEAAGGLGPILEGSAKAA